MYLMDRGPLRLAILLVDSRREPQKSDLEMVQFLNEEGLPFVVVATKVDKLKRDELQRSAGAIRKAYSLGANQPLLFSSVTGQGKKELWRVIRDVIIGKSELLELGESDGEDEEDNGQITEDYEPDELESYMD
jgi:GTP-binding protein